ncbi:MAG: biotin--[acetyl-CoA-carboxylase] ligase [Fidelibacterota bacterium]|nr:MAG: biotin--[acetyl-CoA-carboxylase] ligase [Candidatus Neomarinimicrobiota bacterium]
MLSVKLVQDNLITRCLGREITYYPATDSTNDDLWSLFDRGTAVNGQVVVTDEQRRGKGRQGRSWFSAPGLGLTFSMLLRPQLPAERLGLVSLAAGVAVVDALVKQEVAAQLKWPNDVLVNQLKLGGILAESRVAGEEITVVLGIGLNVNEQLGDFPEELRSHVISVQMASGHPVQREILLAEILARLEALQDGGMNDIVLLWMDRCAHLEQAVTYHGPDGLVAGYFRGVNDAGLGLIEVGGETLMVAAGDLDYESDQTSTYR